MLDVRFREGIEKVVRPVGRLLARLGLTANRLTVLGLVLNILAAAILVTGRFVVAAIVGGIGSIIDMLDGATAKAGKATSRRGAFLDSVADRVSETAVFSAMIWYLSGRSTRLAVLSALALGFSLVISYERARAESLGLDGKAGLFERGERLIVIGIGLLIPGAMEIALWVLVAGTAITAIQRFIYVWRQAEPAPVPVGIAPYRIAERRIGRRRNSSVEEGNEIVDGSDDERDATVFTAFVPRRMRERFGDRSQKRPPGSPGRRRRARGA